MYLTSSLAETKDFVQLRDDVSFVALQDFSRNAFLTRYFARGKGPGFNSSRVASLSSSSNRGRHLMVFSASSVITFSLEYSSE